MRGHHEALITTRLILLYDTEDSTNDVKAGHLAAVKVSISVSWSKKVLENVSEEVNQGVYYGNCDLENAKKWNNAKK